MSDVPRADNIGGVGWGGGGGGGVHKSSKNGSWLGAGTTLKVGGTTLKLEKGVLRNGIVKREGSSD